MERQIQYAAVPATGSKHFAHRVYKTQKPELIPGAFLRVFVDPMASKSDIIRHLDLIRDWLVTGDQVQEYQPETFFCELEAIPRLKVHQKGRVSHARNWRAKDTNGNERLV